MKTALAAALLILVAGCGGEDASDEAASTDSIQQTCDLVFASDGPDSSTPIGTLKEFAENSGSATTAEQEAAVDSAAKTIRDVADFAESSTADKLYEFTNQAALAAIAEVSPESEQQILGIYDELLTSCVVFESTAAEQVRAKAPEDVSAEDPDFYDEDYEGDYYEEEEPTTTVAQDQAIDAASTYLEVGGYSRSGLITQLTSKYGSGFKKADAIFAVKYLAPDWNEQAVLAAKTYLEVGGYSRSGMLTQLTSSYGSGFTKAQATYALNKIGLR